MLISLLDTYKIEFLVETRFIGLPLVDTVGFMSQQADFSGCCMVSVSVVNKLIILDLEMDGSARSDALGMWLA